ncbi:MAG: hypothetical protein GDA43_08345 [Hormoscilla sp. SP5CHS1]|nr:hypothetical protein [Hormoscilla sp. SP12CHS1]MBC6453219.1 hypothetical protein [Hormoscilla sp. SP5CHS1]MBC6472184.1 hypothetical protein [Hormoscilla sp. GM102CHS1]
MQELPDEQKMDELLKLAKNAYEKAKLMYETATEIAEKWETLHEAKKARKQKAGVTE